MKKRKILKGACMAFAMILTVGSLTALADTDQNTTEADDTQDTDQLIFVIGTGGCNARVYDYVKDENGEWAQNWSIDGIVGKNGITDDKNEGDGKTPSGVYSFTMAMGLLPDPGSILSYRQIQPGDLWVDDPASIYYNKFVIPSGVTKDWNSAENLMNGSPYYNYVLALNYNEECVPGKGSAIFLHCHTANPDNGSAGCIRIDQDKVEELVKTVTENSRIVIIPSEEALYEYEED